MAEVNDGLPARFEIRAATAADAVTIRRLIEAADINPTGLYWTRFLIAEDGEGTLIGCGQIKNHTGGMQELASIAVRPESRGQGVAKALIKRLLASGGRPLYLMCRSALVPMYEGFGFRRLAPDGMPRYFQRVTRLAGLAEYFAATGESLAVMKLE